MHITILTLLAAGTSAQFVKSFVPQVAHAYGLEESGEWHKIDDNNNINQHPATSPPTATPSTMMPMAKPSIQPIASSFPYASGMFDPSSSAAPSYSPSYGYAHGHHDGTPSSDHYYVASTTPTHRPSHALHLHQAPYPPASPMSAGHGPAVAPDGHIGVPAGGMGVPPSAQAPEPLNAAPKDSEWESESRFEQMTNPNAGEQSDIAPVAPLAPGTNVAPVQVHDKFGADKGSSFCLGQCFASAEEAQCGPPYGSAVLQSEGCYTCCFSPNEDF
ncbi:hypothetical protein N7481_003345 [Penicillium waksmanii]|uniref:uncharacterized protein n=1 Tax=Penicillium waksmanii TaxID=69791 RepID=UPI0025482741|nr:uncharacterized protein N7481_003345 [Penicillium waksmanii]KAJ5988135.1 hypothetical protein N7481_003345 [Penicillium waksmanii]